MKKHFDQLKKMYAELVSSDFTSPKEIAAKKNITGFTSFTHLARRSL